MRSLWKALDSLLLMASFFLESVSKMRGELLSVLTFSVKLVVLSALGPIGSCTEEVLCFSSFSSAMVESYFTNGGLTGAGT
jgi:hypothetical protein